MKEKMVINEDGSGQFSYGFDMSEIMKMGNAKPDSTKLNKVVDTSFKDQNFEGSDWRGSHFKRVRFAGAKLSKARFDQTILEFVDFSDADLRGAQFAGALCFFCNFDRIKKDETTVMPKSWAER